jgi:hypothetical protein
VIERDHDGWFELTIDDELQLGYAPVLDADCVAVETAGDLRRFCSDILSARERPLVGFAPGLEGEECRLTFADIRQAVGPGVRIYRISCEDLLHDLREMLGPELAIQLGTVRIWWPTVGERVDPGEHPAVAALEGEPRHILVEELASQFDLSRPRVRAQIRLIEDARAFVEYELTRAVEQNRRMHEQLRDVQIECHGLRMRAEVAEANLGAAQQHSVDPEGRT